MAFSSSAILHLMDFIFVKKLTEKTIPQIWRVNYL